MKNKIIIIGSSSNLAKQIIETLSVNSYKLKQISRNNFNYIYEYKKLFRIICSFKPKIIINCAAIVKIDYCEKKPFEAYEVNSFFPFRLTIISKKINAILIHFSTDAVFEGNNKSTYKINDVTLPTTIYGKSKLLGEKYISGYKKALIIRLSLLYGKHHRNQIVSNLLNKLKKNEKIFAAKDIYCTPTNSEDIAIFLKKNIDNSNINKLIKKKILHLSSNKRLSVYNFIKKISRIIGKTQNVVAVKDSFFNKSIRPKKLGLKTSERDFNNSTLKKFINDMKKYDKKNN